MSRDSSILKIHLADLKKLAVFEAVPDRKLRRLLSVSRKRVMPKNTVVFLEDEPASTVYFLLAGSISITVDLGEPHRSTVYRVQPGQCVGWSALLPPYLYSATAQCTEPSLAVEMDAVALNKMMQKDTKLGYLLMTAFAQVISNRMHDTRTTCVEMMAQQRRLERVLQPA